MHDEVLEVPLIVRLPKDSEGPAPRPGTRIDAAVSLLDIVLTVLEVIVRTRLDRMLESLDLAAPELDNAQGEALKALGYVE